MSTRMAKPTAEQRFWRFVSQGDGCWEWHGTILDNGYGQFYTGTKRAQAHRFSFELSTGRALQPYPIEVIDHLCLNPACVRPDHLEAVTPQENAARARGPARTHCPRGHEYAGDNLIRVSTRPLVKMCRTCKNALRKEREQRVRDQVAADLGTSTDDVEAALEADSV